MVVGSDEGMFSKEGHQTSGGLKFLNEETTAPLLARLIIPPQAAIGVFDRGQKKRGSREVPRAFEVEELR